MRNHDHSGNCQGFGLNGAWMLLVDESARNNFQNMTFAEINALKQQKVQELQNMTLAEIDALKQKKMEERSNMTLAELKEQGANWKGMHGLMKICDGTGQKRDGSCRA